MSLVLFGISGSVQNESGSVQNEFGSVQNESGSVQNEFGSIPFKNVVHILQLFSKHVHGVQKKTPTFVFLHNSMKK